MRFIVSGEPNNDDINIVACYSLRLREITII
jgi:hypothetical protein